MIRATVLLTVLFYAAPCFDNDSLIMDDDDHYQDESEYEEDWEGDLDEDELEELDELEEMEVMPFKEVVEDPVRQTGYAIGNTLKPGDVLKVHGSYGLNDENYSVTLMGDTHNIILRIVGQRKGKKYFLKLQCGATISKRRTRGSLLKNGENFKIEIAVFDEYYKVYINDAPEERHCGYEQDSNFALVKYILLSGGNEGLKWTRIVMPGEQKFDKYLKWKAFQTTHTGIEQRIRSNLRDTSTNVVKQYANSTEGTMDLLRWTLFRMILERGEEIDLEDSTIQWILSDRASLEMFMTSGDVRRNRYKAALTIFAELIREDPLIKTVSLRMQLAVATALTFSSPVPYLAVGRNDIDPISRYKYMVQMSDEGVFFEQFYIGTAWHLRYVVGALQSEEEQEWARANIADERDNPEMIGTSGAGKVAYIGWSADRKRLTTETDEFYYMRPITLKRLHELGGACGARARMSVGLINSRGVPALLVGQTKHASFMWYSMERKWIMGRQEGTWGAASKTQDKYQYTWLQPSRYFKIMERAQRDLPGYKLSENMRIAAKLMGPADKFRVLEEALTVFPYNVAVWMDLEDAMEDPTLEKVDVQSALLPVWDRLASDGQQNVEEISFPNKAIVTSPCFTGSLIDGTGSTAKCDETTGELFIEFPKPATVDSIYIEWRGKSKPKKYRIYAMGDDDTYVLVRTHKDERVKGRKNPESFLDGFDMNTRKIKIEMSEGKLDQKNNLYYFIIQVFDIKGVLIDPLKLVSGGKEASSSELSTGAQSLVDDDEDTLWTANAENSWFEINLGIICAIDNIEFSWVEDALPDHLTISYKVGNGPETEFHVEQPFDKVSLDREAATTIKVYLSGGSPVLREVRVMGYEYSSKDILKFKLNESYEAYPQVQESMVEMIDVIEYTDIEYTDIEYTDI